MRHAILFTIVGLLASCGGQYSGGQASAGPPGSTTFGLTINNFDAWCDVTAKVGTTTVATLSGSTQSAGISPPQPPGATITLTATPHSGFTTARWQGTTTSDMSGNATYVMTSAAGQMVTVCCPFSNGTGCPF